MTSSYSKKWTAKRWQVESTTSSHDCVNGEYESAAEMEEWVPTPIDKYCGGNWMLSNSSLSYGASDEHFWLWFKRGEHGGLNLRHLHSSIVICLAFSAFVFFIVFWNTLVHIAWGLHALMLSKLSQSTPSSLYKMSQVRKDSKEHWSYQCRLYWTDKRRRARRR